MDNQAETRTVHDPFLGKDVQISDRLTDRLRGRYAQGPTMANGEPEFGWREFPSPPIQHDAADAIDRLRERCAAYKGQVEAGAARIAELEKALREVTECYVLRFGGNIVGLKANTTLNRPYEIATSALSGPLARTPPHPEGK